MVSYIKSSQLCTLLLGLGQTNITEYYLSPYYRINQYPLYLIHRSFTVSSDFVTSATCGPDA